MTVSSKGQVAVFRPKLFISAIVITDIDRSLQGTSEARISAGEISMKEGDSHDHVVLEAREKTLSNSIMKSLVDDNEFVVHGVGVAVESLGMNANIGPG